MSVPLIGEILTELGRLTRAQVAEVVAQQKRSRQKFGQIAVRLGWVTPDQVWEAWAIQMSYRRRFIEPREVGIDTAAVARVTIPTARALRILPLRLWGDNLVVAGAPGTGGAIFNTLSEQTRCRVHACMACPESIQYQLDHLEETLRPGEAATLTGSYYG